MSDAFAHLPYRPCVGVMLVNQDGHVFVGQRIDDKAKNPDSPYWQMPQGGIDPGEDVHEAALRELWEETGVGEHHAQVIAQTREEVLYDLPDELMGRIWGGKYRGQRQKWFLYRFLGRDEQINIATDHPEFSRWRWIGADEMLATIVPFKRAVYDEVVHAFRGYLA